MGDLVAPALPVLTVELKHDAVVSLSHSNTVLERLPQPEKAGKQTLYAPHSHPEQDWAPPTAGVERACRGGQRGRDVTVAHVRGVMSHVRHQDWRQSHEAALSE